MTAWRMYVFPTACVAFAIGATLYGADAQLHLIISATAALCWVIRNDTHNGIISIMCAVVLSGGVLALVANAAASGVAGMIEASILSLVCAVMSGIVVSTQVRPAARLVLGAIRFARVGMSAKS